MLTFLIVFLTGCDDSVILLKELSEQDANEVIGELLSNGIYAEKQTEKEGVSVIISRDDMAYAVSILKSAGLPNKNQVTLGEVFKKEGVISTPLEERARYIYALSQELEYTLSQIDHVIVARVHVVLPERVAPGQPIQPSSAAVFIKHHPDLDPDIIKPRVYSMVSSSIPGLTNVNRDKISVSFVESAVTEKLVQWEKLGPFIVQKKSVAPLKRLLIIYTIVCLILLALLIVSRSPRSQLWLQKRVKRSMKVGPVNPASPAR